MKTEQTIPQPTPGSWKVWRDMDPKEPLKVDAMDGHDPICTLEPWNAEANARLIAAAPELLAMLKKLNYAFYAVGTTKALLEAFRGTKDLIHKAEGRNQ